MRRICSFRKKALRFRRWSRKAYSAFCSIGRCVTIGHLSKGIADASLCKTAVPSLMSAVPAFWPEQQQRESGSPPGIPEGLLLAIHENNQDSSVPAGAERIRHALYGGRKTHRVFLPLSLFPLPGLRQPGCSRKETGLREQIRN